MKRVVFFVSTLMICLLQIIPIKAYADIWGPINNSVGAALAYEGKTSNDARYEGTKVFLEGAYVYKRKQGETSDRRLCCAMPSRPEHLYGLMDGQLRFGLDGTGLEYVLLNITPVATLYSPAIDNGKSFRATNDLVELGALRYIQDDPLEVDYYLEFSLFRAGRTGIYQWNRESPFAITAGVQASAGWSWAETKVAGYSSVSNPFAGLFFKAALEHDNWGDIYMVNRFVNGFSFSNPSRGHPTVREARVTFGYLRELTDNMMLNVYLEKKSFYFDEGGLPGLYRMSRAFAVDFKWLW